MSTSLTRERVKFIGEIVGWNLFGCQEMVTSNSMEANNQKIDAKALRPVRISNKGNKLQIIGKFSNF